MRGPLDLVVETFWALAALGVAYVLPGVALGPALIPGRMSPVERVARSLGASLVLLSIGTTALAALGLLRPTLVVVLALGLAVLPVHGRLRDPRRGLRRARPRRVGVEIVPAVIALGLGGGAIAVTVHAATGGLPVGTRWSDAAAALAVAADGRWPATIAAWGETAPTSGADVLATTHLAAAIQLLPGEPPMRLAIDWVAALGAVWISAAALLRRAVSTPAAVIGGAAFVGLAGVPASAVGDGTGARSMALALLALWLFDRAILGGARADVVRSVAFAALAALGGLPSVAVVAIGVVGIALARVAVALTAGRAAGQQAEAADHRSWRSFAGAALRTAVLPVAIVLGTVWATTVASPRAVAAMADSALQPLAGPGPDARAPSAADERPADWTSTGDSGLDLRRALGIERTSSARPVGASDDVAVLLALAGGRPPLVPIAVVVATLVPLAMWPAHARRRRLWVSTLAVAAAAAVAARLGAVPAQIVTPILWLAASGALALAVWVVSAASSREPAPAPAKPAASVPPSEDAIPRTPRARANGGRPASRRASRSVAVAVGGLVVIGVAVVRGGAGWPAPGVSQAFAALGVTPRDAVILTNGWTDGGVAALAGRVAPLDGPLPDVGTHGAPAVARATALALGARVVFEDPDADAATRYLAREGITHLVVFRAARLRHAGGASTWPVDLEALAASPRLRPVPATDGVAVFEVLPGG